MNRRPLHPDWWRVLLMLAAIGTAFVFVTR